MDKWISILLTVEEMWENSCERAIAYAYPMTDQYCRDRDMFKARHIYELYGYEYFLQFVNRCPHIHDILGEYLPCRNDGQCVIFCKFYEGGCTYATE